MALFRSEGLGGGVEEGVLFFQATRVSGLWGLFWTLQQGAETAGPCLLHPVELISFL